MGTHSSAPSRRASTHTPTPGSKDFQTNGSQLPNAELTAQLGRSTSKSGEPTKDNPRSYGEPGAAAAAEWPSIVERDGFVDLAADMLKLGPSETSVLRRIFFRAGPGTKVCYESQESMARYLRMHEKTVRRALDRLTELGLVSKVTQFHGQGRSNGYLPHMTLMDKLPSAHSWRDARNGIPGTTPGMETDDPSIPGMVSLHSGHDARLTEYRTDIVPIHSSEEGIFELEETSDPEYIGDTSVHSGHHARNGGPSVPIPGIMPGMEEELPPAPPCKDCGNPWTTPERQRELTLRDRRMKLTPPRERQCDNCWQAELNQKQSELAAKERLR